MKYIDRDLRILANVNPEEMAAELFHNATLTAVDLSQIDGINGALNDLTVALSSIDQTAVAQARSYAQAYESVFGDDWPSPYIDLGSFLSNVTALSDDANLNDAAIDVMTAIDNAVVAERHGEGRPGSTGMAIFFPVPAMHSIGENFGYSQVAARFTGESLWDEFLAFHSSGGIPQSFSRPEPSLEEQVNAQFGELMWPEDVEILFMDIAD